MRTTLDSNTMSKGVALDCEMASASASGRYMPKTFDTESGTTADTCYVSQDESKTDAEKLGQQEDTGWDHNQNKLTLHRSVSIYFSQTLPQVRPSVKQSGISHIAFWPRQLQIARAHFLPAYTRK